MPLKRLQRSLRVTLIGMVINTFLAAGKLVAGIAGHSHALIADAVESLADIFSSLVVWRGLIVAAAPADEEHPYGHGKAEPIAAAIVSTMLLLAAAGIVAKSLEAIVNDHQVGPRPFTLIVVISVIVIKETLFRYVVKTAEKVDSSAVKADAWHHRSDAITSLAAAIGISIALWGGKGYERADSIAAIIGAVIIGFNGWQLLRPSLNELMDAAPNREMVEQINATALKITGVERVEQCRARKSGNRYWVDMHIEVDPEMSVKKGHGISHDVKDKIRAKFPAVRDVLVHIEPATEKTIKLRKHEKEKLEEAQGKFGL